MGGQLKELFVAVRNRDSPAHWYHILSYRGEGKARKGTEALVLSSASASASASIRARGGNLKSIGGAPPHYSSLFSFVHRGTARHAVGIGLFCHSPEKRMDILLPRQCSTRKGFVDRWVSVSTCVGGVGACIVLSAREWCTPH